MPIDLSRFAVNHNPHNLTSYPFPSGLHNVTNVRGGVLHGPYSSWARDQVSELGVVLLFRAMLVYLSDGEKAWQKHELVWGIGVREEVLYFADRTVYWSLSEPWSHLTIYRYIWPYRISDTKSRRTMTLWLWRIMQYIIYHSFEWHYHRFALCQLFVREV